MREVDGLNFRAPHKRDRQARELDSGGAKFRMRVYSELLQADGDNYNVLIRSVNVLLAVKVRENKPVPTSRAV